MSSAGAAQGNCIRIGKAAKAEWPLRPTMALRGSLEYIIPYSVLYFPPPMANPASPRRPTRGPKKLQAQLLAIEGVAAARRQILARRATANSGDVIQADVDLVATALVAARERPYPQSVVAITGGSLSTVTPLFHDWFMRFAYRDPDTKTVSLDAPARIPMLVQHLVAQFVMAVREQIRDVPDPLQALIAAAQLGEQQALKSQLSTVTAQRDQLQRSVEALSYRIANLSTELAARRGTDDAQQVAVTNALEAIRIALAGLPEQLAPATPDANTLAELVTQVGELRVALNRQRRRRPSRPARARPVRSKRTTPQRTTKPGKARYKQRRTSTKRR
jgi:hypothetical protein